MAFIANGGATKPAEPGERALDHPAEHAKAAAVGGEAITMCLRIVATVALQDVGQVRDQGVEDRTSGFNTSVYRQFRSPTRRLASAPPPLVNLAFNWLSP